MDKEAEIKQLIDDMCSIFVTNPTGSPVMTIRQIGEYFYNKGWRKYNE